MNELEFSLLIGLEMSIFFSECDLQSFDVSYVGSLDVFLNPNQPLSSISLSLIVSSIMIAIITYVSVIERTKEIGVLRSLGASKRNVANVFNAETLLIGFVSGGLGVLISSLLTSPY